MMDLFAFIGKFIKEGGFFMHPITLLLAFGIAVVLERFYVLFKKFNLDNGKYFNFVQQKLAARETVAAIKGSPDVPLSNIIKFGLEMVERYDKEGRLAAAGKGSMDPKNVMLIEKTVEEVAAMEFPKIEKRLNMLPMVANLSTLLGLLGTLQGLIQSFSSLSSVDPAMKATALSQGISVAMNTTAYGLFVAVLVLFMHAILTSRAETLVEETEYYVLKFINLISARY